MGVERFNIELSGNKTYWIDQLYFSDVLDKKYNCL